MNDVAIETPGRALFEMWSVFLDMYNDKTKEKQSESDVELCLNGYIYDYLVKKNLHYVALSFMTELKVSLDPVGMFFVLLASFDCSDSSCLFIASLCIGL